ncbi:hypothetical protein G7046_g4683 [Stylonectria norvegica]|nr:hypothetical protein G7046_g4683 [Stylonectria norvegica]
MTSTTCLQHSRRALYRVFVSPLERRHEASVGRQLLPLLHSRRSLPPSGVVSSLHLLPQQSRSFVTPTRRLHAAELGVSPDKEERTFDKRFTTKHDIEKSGRDRMPQDHEITDPRIMVLDNGKFEGPVMTRHVLSRLDAASESLRMVQPYVPARPKDSVVQEFAICKIVNKKDEYARQRELKERKRVQRATTTKSKELELNWAIDGNDLNTKLRQLSNFLGKGMKVEVIFGKKKSSKKVDEAAAAQVVATVRKSIEELGAKETKLADGSVGKTLRLYLEGKANKSVT